MKTKKQKTVFKQFYQVHALISPMSCRVNFACLLQNCIETIEVYFLYLKGLQCLDTFLPLTHFQAKTTRQDKVNYRTNYYLNFQKP